MEFGTDLLEDLLKRQEEIINTDRRLSQKFEQYKEALASPLLRPSKLGKKLSKRSEPVGGLINQTKRKALSPPVDIRSKSHINMERKIDEIIANMAKTKDVEKFASEIRGRLDGVEKKQDEFGRKQEDILERIEDLEKDQKRADTRANKTEQRLKRLTEETQKGASKNTSSDAKAYELARKQLTLFPVSPDIETVRIFLERQMEIEPEAARSIEITNLKRLYTREKGKSKNGCKTVVTFGSIQERDLVISHASNLPDGCSLELVIPDYLQSLKRYLERFAYKVRKYARDAHETRFSTSIRMDDIEQTLYLATREAGESDWIFYSKEDLKDLDGALKKIDERILEETEMMEDTLPSSKSNKSKQ